MNLLEVRKMFVKLSGRYDLVIDTTDWVDDGANFFLQAGQNVIEKLVGDLPESEGRIWNTISADAYYLGFQSRSRAIFQVWVNDSESRIELEKVSWGEMKELYSSSISSVSTGFPRYFCPAKLREIDATGKNVTGIFSNFSLPVSSDFRGILIMPPADKAYDLEILGKFLQPELSSDLLENFWTLIYPELLIRAAMYQNELMYRGKESTGKLLNSLMLEISEIEKDGIEETIHGVDQIEG